MKFYWWWKFSHKKEHFGSSYQNITPERTFIVMPFSSLGIYTFENFSYSFYNLYLSPMVFMLLPRSTERHISIPSTRKGRSICGFSAQINVCSYSFSRCQFVEFIFMKLNIILSFSYALCCPLVHFAPLVLISQFRTACCTSLSLALLYLSI